MNTFARNDTLKKELDSLEKDWARLAADLSKTWKSALAYGSAEAGEKKEELEDEVKKQLDGLRKEFNSTCGKGKKIIQENPWKSVTAVFGLGLFIGKMLERKSK